MVKGSCWMISCDLPSQVEKETGHNITHLRKMREDRQRLVNASKEKVMVTGTIPCGDYILGRHSIWA